MIKQIKKNLLVFFLVGVESFMLVKAIPAENKQVTSDVAENETVMEEQKNFYYLGNENFNNEIEILTEEEVAEKDTIIEEEVQEEEEEIDIISSFEIYSPYYDGKKTWMDYRMVTDRKSTQYNLLRNYSYTGDYGIRMVDNRFCVAVGSRFSLEIGQYFDLVLENGFIIPCIKGDAKSNVNTDSTNTFTITNNSYCCSEFIVDQTVFQELFPGVGNLSKIDENWNSKVIEIIVYDYNIFNAAREL